jgi:indole-3-glycerol phosphate synthase
VILDDILQAKREEVAEHRRLRPLEELRDQLFYAEPRRGFAAALARPGRAVIAEVKKASPSRGVIRADFDPVAIARAYERSGARALSVLTDAPFFQGSLVDLAEIRRAVGLPLLRKDFTIDPYQVHEARAFGADAVLLIVAVLEDGLLAELQGLARDLGLDALVEVHTREELDRALAAGATLVGVNNRDLRTFVTRLEVTEELATHVPPGVTLVAESGVRSAAEIARLERAGARAFLVGESLMAARDPGEALRALLEAGG